MPDGTPVTSKCKTIIGFIFPAARLPHVGDRVDILYDPQNPNRVDYGTMSAILPAIIFLLLVSNIPLVLCIREYFKSR